MKQILLTLHLLFCFLSFAQSNNNYDKSWATYFGGQGTRIVNSVVDSENNIIVAGIIIGGSVSALQDATYYNQFVTTTKPTNLYNPSIVSSSGVYSNQSIVAKFSPAGNLIHSIYIGIDIVHLEINSNDELYISGTSTQNNLGTIGVWLSSPIPELVNEPQKGIMAKLNNDFSVNWFSYLPTTNYGVFCMDSSENIYIATTTHINNSITTSGTFQPHFLTELESSGQDYYDNGYLFMLNSQGQLQWGTYYGLITPLAISYDNDQLIVSALREQMTLSDYDSYYYTFNAYQDTPTTQIISKFNASTGQRIYSTYLGNNNISITHIVNQNGSYYFLGNVYGTAISDSNLVNSDAFQPTFNGLQDIYLGKFDSSLIPVWGTYIGGNDYEETINQSQLNIKDNALYFNGFSYSSGFVNSPNPYQSNNQGSGDLFMMKFSLNGDLVWGSYFGGNDAELYGSIAPVNEGSFYWVGETHSQNNISTSGSHQQSMNINPSFNSFNLGNGFISRFNHQALAIDDFSFYDIDIYPNPSNGIFTIKSNSSLQGSSNLTLYNTLGQHILTKKLDFRHEKIIKLNLLSSGIYYLKLENEQRTITKKIIIN